MVILGIDYGDARTGVSLSDPLEMLAGRPGVIETRKPEELVRALAALCEEARAEAIVLGLPLNMDGSEGSRAEKTRALAALLTEATGLSVALWDERRSTVDAHRILTENRTFGKKRKQRVDAVAATLILQGYLDFRRLERERT